MKDMQQLPFSFYIFFDVAQYIIRFVKIVYNGLCMCNDDLLMRSDLVFCNVQKGAEDSLKACEWRLWEEHDRIHASISII